ncbi:hypothetical protein [Ulvibacterium marinum]|uniref:Uncharacterized protein n=1 Tax=Ulvibacterium marinum TaxID=2419782 RepID=A0A3B0C1X0_9FLAO|nr:hypothetical protein [Ulvibacterium marinum]RKN80275.1 hypothetical protein D7Z94_18800 [Ulvibacterium marinum]
MKRKSVTIRAAWIGAGTTIFTTLLVFVFDVSFNSDNSSSNGNSGEQNIETAEGDVINGNKIINETNVLNEKEDFSEDESNFDKVLNSDELNLSGYKINQAIKLNDFSNGLNGALLLLTDERLEGISGDLEFYGHTNTFFPTFETKDVDPLSEERYKQAIIVLVNDRLKILYFEELGRESARIDRIFPYAKKNKPVFLVTVDYSVGWGSYNGPISYFLEINENGINYILDKKGFMISLKSIWLINNRNGKSEILDIDCRPDFDKNSENPDEFHFKLIYSWYFFENNEWKRLRKEKPGCIENDWTISSFDIYEFYDFMDPPENLRKSI